jgi:hypothetical protein
MSDRTWLGDSKLEWADYNRCDFASLEDLCKAAAWKLPAKVLSPSREKMDEFLRVMEDRHSMTMDDFWTLNIGNGKDGEWAEYMSTPTRASIETMAMFGDFLNISGLGKETQ